MATIKKHLVPKVRSLYLEHEYSAARIAQELNVSIDAVYYTMRRYGIARRNKSQNSAITFKNKPLSYSLKDPLSADDEVLKIIGITLYWAEGYKSAKSHGIDFANSDVAAVCIFTRFMREICGVDESRLRILLYCYADQDIDTLVSFWSKTLKIPPSQFTKPYVRTDYRVEKKGKMPYGLVHVRYSDKKLLAQLKIWMDEYRIRFCVGGRVVNYTAL